MQPNDSYLNSGDDDGDDDDDDDNGDDDDDNVEDDADDDDDDDFLNADYELCPGPRVLSTLVCLPRRQW